MSRPPSRKLPQIAVEEEAVRTKLDLPVGLNSDLELYAHYFAAKTGRKPLTMGHVIVGLLETYLAESPEFQRWKREERAAVDTTLSPFAQAPNGKDRAAESTAPNGKDRAAAN